MSGLGGANGDDEAGGIFRLDCESFDPLGPWETERGPQRYQYHFWWHLNQDTLVSSEWATPAMFEHGVVPEKLLAGEYGHAMHVWDLRRGKHLQTLELGPEQQMVLELRPAHDPRREWASSGSSSPQQTSRRRSGTGTARRASGRSARRSRSPPSRRRPSCCRP